VNFKLKVESNLVLIAVIHNRIQTTKAIIAKEIGPVKEQIMEKPQIYWR